VAGTFNNWNPDANKLTSHSDYFDTEIELAPGVYEYKFVINGQWHIDPDCGLWACNSFGTMNSVIKVE
jgi:hypothetical protein